MFWQDFESIFSWWNVYINIDSVSETGAVTYSILTSEYKQPWVLFKIHKLGFQGNKTYQKSLIYPLQLILTSYAIYTKIVSEYDQEIPQSQTADNPMAPRGRAAQPSQDTRKTN